MKYEELRDLIFHLADEHNKYNPKKKVPYEFITLLCNKIEKLMKGV